MNYPLHIGEVPLTSWREFRASLRPILLLALGLVLVTTFVIAVVAHTIAGLSWPVAFVLGAVVSPTDAVAASATAKQLDLPRLFALTLCRKKQFGSLCQ